MELFSDRLPLIAWKPGNPSSTKQTQPMHSVFKIILKSFLSRANTDYVCSHSMLTSCLQPCTRHITAGYLLHSNNIQHQQPHVRIIYAQNESNCWSFTRNINITLPKKKKATFSFVGSRSVFSNSGTANKHSSSSHSGCTERASCWTPSATTTSITTAVELII